MANAASTFSGKPTATRFRDSIRVRTEIRVTARQGKAGQLMAAATLALLSVPLVGSTGLGTNFDSRLLAAHNRERSAAGIAPLSWSDDLAADAAEWAETLAEANDLVHAEDEDPYDPQGENLWLGTRAAYAPEEMVGMWIDEKRHFKPGIFPNVSRTGDLEDVGHYTQLMWRDTGRVGCAKSANEENEVLVCRYAAAGNVIGERPF
jgi:hypothetical protein